MKELIREPDIARMGLCRSILEGRGIAVEIRNDNEFNALSLSMLNKPRHDPALCVVNEEDYEIAMEVLREHFSGEEKKSREEVACASCGETNPGNFEICWSCGGVVAGVVAEGEA